MQYNDRYKLHSNSPESYASAVEKHIVDSSKESVLPIDESTVALTGKAKAMANDDSIRLQYEVWYKVATAQRDRLCTWNTLTRRPKPRH